MIPFVTYVNSRPKDGFGNPTRAKAIALILESDDSADLRNTADFKQWAQGLEPELYVEAASLWNEWHVMHGPGKVVYRRAKGWL